MSEFTSLSALLDQVAPTVPHEEAAWDDVLMRSRVAEIRAGVQSVPATSDRRRPRGRRRSHLLIAAAVLGVALVVVAATLAAGGLHDFTAWLTGTPGRPAPPADQSGFSRRNAAAFARFPAGTKLLLLTHTNSGGKTFNLLGFRNGDSLCLRVVRADLPAGRGSTQCASLLELEQSAAPAIVVADASFSFGRPASTADGIYGFADDSVRRIDVVRERTGTHSIPVGSNAFLSLAARPSGTATNPSAQDPITGIYAVRADGGRVRLAYIAGGGVGTQTAPPKPPFYLKASPFSSLRIPGPSKATQQFAGGTISWVFAHQRRGEPFVLSARRLRHFGRVLFARAVQPDPNKPDRVGLLLVRRAPHPFGPKTPTHPVLCFSPLQPLGQLSGMSCIGGGPQSTSDTQPFLAGSPIYLTFVWPTQISHIVGIAADDVRTVEAFLANGRIIPIPVRDNAFIADVPQSVPAKIVAYDKEGRTIAVVPVSGPTIHYAPCPRFVTPSKPIPNARPYERVDLGSGEINGQRIIGANESAVVAALGKPERILRNTVINGVRIPLYIYGGTSQAPGTTQIQFGKHGTRIVAVSISFESQRVVDRRLGHVLAIDPATLQQEIARSYARYRLSVGYGTLDAHGCQFTYNSGHFVTHLMLTVQLDTRHPSQLVLILRNGY
jgi:hypothetical protein